MTDQELLKQQAEFLGMPFEVYRAASVAERNVAKGRYVRQFRIRLKKHGKTPEQIEAAVEEKMKEFPQLVKTNSSEIRARKKKAPTKKTPSKKSTTEVVDIDADEEEEEEIPPYDVQDGGVRVYHENGTTPPKEPKERRDGPTLGPIQEREHPPDLVGDRAPRTLNDLYARWPLGEDSSFFLRVERTAPKKYHGVDVSGYLGDVREKISEAELQRLLGGREYKLTLYGPDPLGRTNGEGELRIKALTDPITLTVPVVPPVMNALKKEEGPVMSMNPFGPTTAAPTTPADAQIHRANASFFADMVKLTREEDRRKETANQQATTSFMSYMSETQKAQQEQVRKEAERREQEYKQQLEDLKQQLKAEKEAQSTVATQVAQAKDDANSSFMRFVEKMGPDKEAEIKRLSEYYTSQLDIVRRAHDDQTRAMRERHDSDLRRADERLKDAETKYQHLLEQERQQSRTMLDQERSQWTQRESDLRQQMKEQTEAERSMAMQRISDMKERHEAEIKQLEKGHERELRTLKDSAETRTSVSDQTHQITVSQLEMQLSEAKEEIERLKQEVEEAKDLPAQLEKMQAQAEILGYEKKDANEPKTAMERFAATAGAGLAQLMQNAGDWVPEMMASRQQQQQAVRGALPPQQQRMPPQQRPVAQPQQQQSRRTRGAQWAASGVQVRPPRPEPMGFEGSSDVQPNPSSPTPTRQASAAQQEVVSNPPPVQNEGQESKSVTTNGQSAPAQISLPPKFVEAFGAEAILGFLQEAEKAVKGHVDPWGFAGLMVSQLPEGAETLVTRFTVAEVLDAVKGIPGTEASPLLRRDGKKWMQSLFSAIQKQLAERISAKPPESVPQTTA